MKDLYRIVDQKQDEYIEELKPLLRIPAVSYTGEGIAECAEWLADWLRSWGCEARVVPTKGHPVVLGKISPPDPCRRVMVYGHYDVKQPGERSEWDSDPFEPVIKDGAIYARGSADNKGQLFANTLAVRLLHEQKRLNVAVTFVFEGEEEIGSRSFQGFAEENREALEADIQYAADGPRHRCGRPSVVAGNRGTLGMRLIVRNEVGAAVHSGNYGEIVRNPAWDLVHLLHRMKTPEGEVLIPGFYDKALPPNELERKALAEIPDVEEEVRRELGVERLYGPENLSMNEKIMFRPTLTIEGFVCGMESTIIPGRAMCFLEVRMVKDMTPEDTFETVKRFVDAQNVPGAELVFVRGGVPTKTPLDDPLVQRVFGALQKLHAAGELDAPPVLLPNSGGSNASKYTSVHYLGLPSLNVNYGQVNTNGHGPNEHFRIDNFRGGIKMGLAALAVLGEE